MALELTPAGSNLIDENLLEGELRRLLGVDESWPIFIPARLYEKNGRTIALHLMEGYCFVATGLDEVRYFRLEKTKLVERVMAAQGSSGLRVLRVVPDAEVAKLRDQLRDQVTTLLSLGARVKVMHGLYASLEGEVVDNLDEDAEHILVCFKFRSLERIARIPRAFVEVLERDEYA